MSEENTDWGKSVAGVVLYDGKVLPTRHTYGAARSDHDENSEVVRLDIEKALAADDVPDLTKKLIAAAVNGTAMPFVKYIHREKGAPVSLYCTGFNGERSTK